MTRKQAFIIKFLVLIFLFPLTCLASSIDVLLKANPESDIAGYKIFYGTTPNKYPNIIDIGNKTSYTINNTLSGNYYVSVKVYDTSNNESVFSDETSILVPVSTLIPLTPLNNETLSTSPVFTWSGDGYKLFTLYMAKGNGGFSKSYSGTSKSYKMPSVIWYWFISSKSILKWYVVGTDSNNVLTKSTIYTFTKK